MGSNGEWSANMKTKGPKMNNSFAIIDNFGTVVAVVRGCGIARVVRKALGEEAGVAYGFCGLSFLETVQLRQAVNLLHSSQ